MNSSKLKLNPDKTEFIVFGSKVHRNTLPRFAVNILGNMLSPGDKARILGVISSFHFSAQVSSICGSSYYHIRYFLQLDVTSISLLQLQLQMHWFVVGLDYCNSLLNSISKYDLERLNSIQYSLCRIIQQTCRFSRAYVSSSQVVALASGQTTY